MDSVKKIYSKDKNNTIEIDTNKIFSLLKYIGFFVLFYALFTTKIFGVLSPCFYGLFVCLMFLDSNIYYLSLSYLSAIILYSQGVEYIVFALILCVALFIISYIHKKRKKIIPVWASFIYCLLCGVPYVFLFSSTISEVYFSVINVCLNSLFMLCCSNFFKILKNRKFNLNLNIDETVCGMLILCLLFCAMCNFNSVYFDVVKMFGFLLILFSNVIFPNSFCVFLSIVMGLGTFLNSSGLEYITLFSLVSVFCYIFKNQHKIFSVLSLLIIDVTLNLFVLLFGQFNWFSLIPSVLSCVIFMIVPKKYTNKIFSSLLVKNNDNTLKNILNQNKMQMSKKLLFASEIFYEMDKCFRKLVKGNINPNDAKLMLANEIIRDNCEDCPQRHKCLKGFNSEHKKIFESLINIGFEKGKITLVDLPQYLTTRCGKLNQLINSINNLLSEYKSFAKVNSDLDSSKLLIAEQLKGVSYVLSTLSSQTNEVVKLDYKFENVIKETLIYNDIVANEVVCFEKNEQTSVISMILRSIDYDNERISKILSQLCKHKMVLDEIVPCESSGLTYVSYKTAPNYDIALGLAKENKGGNDESGDTHYMMKLSNEKLMLVICDGMGSGQKAHDKSEISLNIIENFYKVGFDNETILSCVNKLLNLNSDNVFSAVDISVIDLKNGEVDFIKQGATVGFIKKDDEVIKIESNSLPLGILDNVCPKLTKTVLTPEDFVIMLSDGVVDAFGEEKLMEYLKYLPSSSPQGLADDILNKAKKNNKNYPDDDMTVICGRLFYN